jgi:23S rRNA (guanosine2251-2'-O)-methyltransferase
MAKGVRVEEPLASVLDELSKSTPIEKVPRSVLDDESSSHQGFAALVDPYPYANLDEIIALAANSSFPGLILVLDLLQDPQNVGTLLRTAEAMGVHGIILAKRRAVGVTPAVMSSSAGAAEHMLIAQENIASALTHLKEADYWIAGLEHADESMDIGEADLSGNLALVIGSEGEGLRRLVRASCDYLIRIPMRGKVGSLNASAAGSIALYAVQQSRSG